MLLVELHDHRGVIASLSMVARRLYWRGYTVKRVRMKLPDFEPTF